MAEIHHVTPDRHTGALADVIFVHGLGGDKFTTWQATQSRESFWPEWLGKDLPDVAVYSLGYEASPSAWLGHAMPLTERATNILNLLESEGLGVRPLIWICHSLGGLVVKQLLQTAEIQNQLSWKCFVENTKAIVFLSTPHAGTQIANAVNLMGKLLRTTAGMTDLQASNEHLRYLSLWYSNNAARLKIETRVFYEKRDLGGIRIVNEDTANPGISGVMPVAMDDHHLSICKPVDRNQQVYKSARLLVSQYENPKPSPRTQSDPATNSDLSPTIDGRPARFFVSYRRRAEPDARLALFLVERLRASGCEVFIDREMLVGTDWSAKIDERIAWCDYLVVLLSQESVSSEMVQAEVRRAHHAGQKAGRSKVLPIRIAYTGALGYELDGHIGKLQYALWQSVADDSRIADEILRASGSDGMLRDNTLLASTPDSKATDRPEPKADMRLLRESLDTPGSALDSDNPFYIRREPDARLEEFAKGKIARTLVIKAPSQSGKSSLLRRYLAQCLTAGKKFALIDLMMFGSIKSLSLPDFAKQFAEVLMSELDISGVEAPTFARSLALTNFINDQILPRVDGPIVIAIDEVDRPIGSPWQEDFYLALRNWDSNRTNPKKKERWGRVGLAFAIATDPKMLIDSGYTSPFNMTPPVVLRPFARAALDAFNTSYKQMLNHRELDLLYELLRGHAYLTPLAFYRLIYDESTFDALCDDAAKEYGPFGDHLRSKLDRLYTAGLIEAMREIVLNGKVPGNDRRLFYRLEAAGLAREDSGRILSSNEVYERFFKAVL